MTRDSANKVTGQDQALYYYSSDTTAQWGDRWDPRLRHNITSGHWRLYVNCRVEHYENSIWLIQSAEGPSGRYAHKVIFGPSGPGTWDVCNYAETHLGTPYWYGGKQPYSWIDCSGFVTAVKIQQLGAGNNTRYRFNSNSVKHYVDGYYIGPDGKKVIIATKVKKEADVLRGDLVALAKKPKKGASANWRHIVLIKSATIKKGVIAEAQIVHAVGGPEAINRQVRTDELIATFPKGSWRYKFLRFAE